MLQPGSIVKCIKGAEGILQEGATYVVWDITEEGHLKLEEVNPPEPYTCFNKNRFEDTGDYVLLESFEEWDVPEPFATEKELEEMLAI